MRLCFIILSIFYVFPFWIFFRSARKRPKYTTETIQLALAEIQRAEKPLSVKKAAYKYNIPLSTLNDKFTGKSPPVAMRQGSYM